MVDDAAHLSIHRRSPEDEGERQLFVSLDGERLGMLGFGRQLSRAIGPGEHRVRIHNTFWWKTVTFTATPGQHVQFEAINITPGCMVGIAAALGAAPMFVEIQPARTEGASATIGGRTDG